MAGLQSTILQIEANFHRDPNSWRQQVPAIRYVTSSLVFPNAPPDEARKRWQLRVISLFQRVAYADADNGGVQDIGDWCLRQALAMLPTYLRCVDLLTLIGQNWLYRAQKSLARIHSSERQSSSSSGSSTQYSSQREEQRLQTADYVEARGILRPATDYFQRAVSAAQAQGQSRPDVLTTAAEAYMSLGNVSSQRVNREYFQTALVYLRTANGIANYSLPAHLQQYLDDYGYLLG